MKSPPPKAKLTRASQKSGVGPTSTVQDVAKLARVSTATVSRAINNPDIVRKDVRQRVFAAIEKLGYIPNNAARALRQNATRLIGVIIPTLKYALYTEFVEALQIELLANGFSAVLTTSDYSLQSEYEQANLLIQRGAQGLVFVGHQRDPKLQALLRSTQIPHVDAYAYDPASSSGTIGFDNAEAIASSTDYLISLGHTRLAMLSGITANNDRATARTEGFRRALSRKKLKSQGNVFEANYTIEGGRKAFRSMWESGLFPTGVVCGSDMLALGAMLECEALGLSIPGDISIMGFDNLEFAAHLHPPLSTVEVPSSAMGRQTGAYIVQRCRGSHPMNHTKFETKVIVRKTTDRPRQDSKRKFAVS